MIIYKINKEGKATDFQFARKCPEGWKSIESDRIPDDISIYHEQKYIDSEALGDQAQTLINLIKNNEYHLISRRFAGDRSEWETALDKWAAQLEEVKAGKLVEIVAGPVFD